MQDELINFAQSLGLLLTSSQADTLLKYAGLVLQKKNFLNLTGAADLREIVERHLCDGLVCAAKINGMAGAKGLSAFTVADMGAGGGFIGMTLAVALPQAQVTLVESIEKRCAFMNWAVLNTGIKNAAVKNARLGQNAAGKFDFVTERAMGRLPDILEICLSAVKAGGAFIAYQGETPQVDETDPAKYGASPAAVETYNLPVQDEKKRHLVLFIKTDK
ncbi:MAG: 16S rRNA (guanine(527)-N(7))-methyltransferase RsmG [Candidatus Avelusimicrobium sp.]|uniref:16S rRNA (guanine(527)-N(7))-methyltransferase RsmG n=1 Tax=Candidatus Avelusimicrobium sp. TaxID=3048833 RepID=UPI003F0D7157